MSNDSVSSAIAWKPTLWGSIFAMFLGGIVAVAAIQLLDPVFPMAPLAEPSLSPTPEEVQIHLQAAIDFRSRNYAAEFATLAACLGGALGLLTTSRRRVRSALCAASVGALAGGLAGYLAGYKVALTLASSGNQSLVQSTIYHFAVWAPILVAISAVIGLVQGPARQTYTYALAGIVAALIAATVYGIVGSMLFPKANLLLLVPESLLERSGWIISYALSTGFGLYLGLTKSSKAAGQNKRTNEPTELQSVGKS